MVDDHYYVRRQKSFADQPTTTRRIATGPKIFVGEWATREGAPTPNFGSALGDAAWMTGLERNATRGDGRLCASARECESRRNAMGNGPDRLRHALKLRFAQLLGAVLFGRYLGTEVVTATLTNAGPRVFTSATRDEKRRKLFVKVVNASSEETALNIALDGVGSVARHATLITLSGKTPNATNSITHPDAVVPVERGIGIAETERELRALLDQRSGDELLKPKQR